MLPSFHCCGQNFFFIFPKKKILWEIIIHFNARTAKKLILKKKTHFSHISMEHKYCAGLIITAIFKLRNNFENQPIMERVSFSKVESFLHRTGDIDQSLIGQ